MAFEQEATVQDGNERDKVEPRSPKTETVPAAPVRADERQLIVDSGFATDTREAMNRQVAQLLPSHLI
ncbi:MAG: hypothetical protein AAB544_03060 [Patescibacteria group bacterium]